jgi:hypothetical protein
VAVGVYEAGGDAFVRCARAPGDQFAFAGRRAGGREPLFPLVWALRLTVGVQEQAPADRAATALRLEEQRGHPQVGLDPAAPLGPVGSQVGVIDG